MPQCLSREQRQKRREDLLNEKIRIQKVMKDNRAKYNELLASFEHSPKPSSQPPPKPPQIKCAPNRSDMKKAAQQQPFVMPPRKEHNLVNRMLAQQEQHEKRNCMMGTRQIHQNIKAFEDFNAPRKPHEQRGKCRKCEEPLPYAGNVKRPELDDARRAIVRGNKNQPQKRQQQCGAPQAQCGARNAGPQQQHKRGFDIGDIDFYEDRKPQKFDVNDIYDYEFENTTAYCGGCDDDGGDDDDDDCKDDFDDSQGQSMAECKFEINYQEPGDDANNQCRR